MQILLYDTQTLWSITTVAATDVAMRSSTMNGGTTVPTGSTANEAAYYSGLSFGDEELKFYKEGSKHVVSSYY